LSDPHAACHHGQRAAHGGRVWDYSGNPTAILQEYIVADVNDPWYSPSPQVIDALHALVPFVNNTPSCWADRLVDRIAAHYRVNPNSLILDAGASPLIERVIVAASVAGRDVVVLDPTYSEYERITEAQAGKIRRFELQPTRGFSIDPRVLARTCQNGPALVVLANPNNPTGTCLERSEVLDVLRAIDTQTVVVVDEVYGDYKPRLSLCRDTDAFPHLVVIRSFSKAFALAGLRVGFAVCGSRVRAALGAIPPAPWSVGLLAQEAAIDALDDTAYAERMIQETIALRNALIAEINTIPGLHALESSTNFFLVEITTADWDSSTLCAALEARKVLVRDCASLGDLMGKRFIRIATRSAGENGRIVAALREVVQV